VRIDTRWATSTPQPFASTPTELAALARTSFLAYGASTVGPLHQATRTVPIVFPVVGDPVAAGFVESLARPGGNVTGFMTFEYSISGKWLELLKQNRAGRECEWRPSGPRHTDRPRPVRRHPGNGAVGREWKCARWTRATPAISSAESRPSRAPRMAA